MSSTEHNFSGALATWRGTSIIFQQSIILTTLVSQDINLSELQKSLDAQGIELVDNQKESVVGRKALADKTKGTPLPYLSHQRLTSTTIRVQKNTG